MKTNLPHSTKTKKVWQKPTLTVMSSTEQIQGGGNRPNFHEVGQANGNFYIAPNANPVVKLDTPEFIFNYYHS